MHIFISYAKVDTYNLAIHLRDQLRQLDGITVWMDETLEPGESWALQIQQEIDAADYVIVLLSPDVNRPIQGKQRRSFVLNEIDYAQQENKPIIPVMAQKTRVPVQIAGVQYIDFTGDQSKGFTRLLRKIAPHLSQPPSVPPTNVPAPTADDNLTPEEAPPLTPAKPPLKMRITGRTRNIVLGIAGLLLAVVVVLAIFNPFNNLTFTSPEDQTAMAGIGTVMFDLVTDGVMVQTATSAAKTQTNDSQLETNQANLAATAVLRTQAADSQLETDEANIAATNVVKTQVKGDQLATSEAALTATDSTATAAPELTSGPATILSAMLPVDPITSNGDWLPLYQSFDGVEMAFVPAGCFMMGSDESEEDAAPAHEQCFDQPFWIDRYEVTNKQYGSTGTYKGDNQPRDSVTWYEAHDFCAARDARLPTEREWEYAARGPDNLIYPWGTDFVGANVVYSLDGKYETSSVGSLPAGNSWVGASDMSGNAIEWVSSAYKPYEQEENPEFTDANDQRDGVMRGGSWNDANEEFLSTFDRLSASRDYYSSFTGFRCARDAAPPPVQDYPLIGISGNEVPYNELWQPIYRTFDGVEMALVPSGCFMMGSDDGAGDQAPAHEQCFDEPFWIDRYEVTNDQYGSEAMIEGDNRPRDSVSWFEARDFCAARDARLPTEREWEYAARGPDNWLYPWGNDLLNEPAVHASNSNEESADVGSMPAGNSWVGASDMSGNLWEWLSSLYWSYPYASDDGREDAETAEARVIRGGSWGLDSSVLGAVYRGIADPNEVNNEYGFRCVRDY